MSLPSGGRSPDDVERLSTAQMWDADAASRMLGMRLVSVGPGPGVVAMAARADMVVAELRGRSRGLGRPDPALPADS